MHVMYASFHKLAFGGDYIEQQWDYIIYRQKMDAGETSYKGRKSKGYTM